MKLVFLLLGLIISQSFISQTDILNLEKYWKFRNSFRESFVKVGPGQGESLPAGSIKPCDCVDDLDVNQDGTPLGATCYGEMHWGDGTIRHGHYLGLLATEYRLLKNSGEDVSAVLNELYYALNALNRLDLNAEQVQSEFYGVNLPTNLNGFFLREDVGQGFGLNWANEEAMIRGTNSSYYHNFRASGGSPNGSTVYGNTYQNVPSNDQVSSLMVGLSLIHKLVDNIWVQPAPSENGFYIITETAAIVDRMVTFISEHNWQLIDVNGWQVANGGGDMSIVSFPLLKAAERITNNSMFSLNINTDIKRRPVATGWLQHCITGYGSDDQLTQSEACQELMTHPLQMAHYSILQDGVPSGILNNQNLSVFQSWQNSGSINTDVQLMELQLAWTDYIPNNWPNVYADFIDDKKLSFLPSPFSDITFDKLNISNYNNTIFFNYGVITGLWNKNQADAFADISGNRCLELTNAVIREEMPLNTKESYKNLLDGLTSIGPYNIVGADWQDTLKLRKFHNNGWGADFRWTDLENSLSGEGFEGSFNAIDYMLFHNLYYLLFESELPEFKEKYRCFCSNEVYSPLINAATLTSDNLGVYSIETIANSNNNLNLKLAYLPNCISDVFVPVNHVVNSLFSLNAKFSNYSSLKIFTNKFQTENAIVTNTGEIDLNTRLIICNTKSLTVQAGGKIEINNGEMILNEGSILDISGTVRVHDGANLKLSGPLSKIIIRNHYCPIKIQINHFAV